MKLVDNKLYSFFETLVNLLMLNILWMIACIPIVTVYPATTAMFGVIREWIRDGGSSITEDFFSIFRREFKRSLLLGIVWTIIGFIIIVNLAFVTENSFPLRWLFLVLNSIAVFIYIATSIYIFPVMVTYEMKWFEVIRQSFYLSMSFPINTIQCAGVIAITVVVASLLPLIWLLGVSACAYPVYWLCNRVFRKVEMMTSDPEI